MGHYSERHRRPTGPNKSLIGAQIEFLEPKIIFWDPNIGWVPDDATSPVTAKQTEEEVQSIKTVVEELEELDDAEAEEPLMTEETPKKEPNRQTLAQGKVKCASVGCGDADSLEARARARGAMHPKGIRRASEGDGADARVAHC